MKNFSKLVLIFLLFSFSWVSSYADSNFTMHDLQAMQELDSLVKGKPIFLKKKNNLTKGVVQKKTKQQITKKRVVVKNMSVKHYCDTVKEYQKCWAREKVIKAQRDAVAIAKQNDARQNRRNFVQKGSYMILKKQPKEKKGAVVVEGYKISRVMDLLDKEPDVVEFIDEYQDGYYIPWEQTVAIRGDCITSNYEKTCEDVTRDEMVQKQKNNDAISALPKKIVRPAKQESRSEESSVVQMNTQKSDYSQKVVKTNAGAFVPKHEKFVKKKKVSITKYTNYATQQNCGGYARGVKVSPDLMDNPGLMEGQKIKVEGENLAIIGITDKFDKNEVKVCTGYTFTAWREANDYGRRTGLISWNRLDTFAFSGNKFN